MKISFVLSSTALAMGGCLIATSAWAFEERQANEAEQVIVVTGKRSTPGAEMVTLDALGDATVLDTPLSVAVFDSKLIEDLQIRSLDGIGKLEPTATMRTGDAQQGSYFMIRGFDATVTLLDGQPGLAGGDVLRSGVPLELFDGVQLVKGAAGGFLFGYSYPGGVLNYTSKKPTDEPFAHVTAGFSSGSVWFGHADASIVNKDATMGARLNIVGEKGDLATLDTGLSRYAIGLNTAFELGETTRLRIDGLHSTRRLSGMLGRFTLTYADPAIPDTPSSRRSYADRYSSNRTEINMLTASLIQDIGEDWVARANLTYSIVDQDFYEIRGNVFNVDGDYIAQLRSNGGRTKTAAAQALVKGSLSTGSIDHSLAFGASVQRFSGFLGYDPLTGRTSLSQNLGTGNMYLPKPVLADPSIGRLGRGDRFRSGITDQKTAFLSDTVEFSDRFSLLLGGRFVEIVQKSYLLDGSRDARTKVSEFIPTGALSYKPSEKTTAYISYTKSVSPGGFASPTASNANEPLPPILSKQYELGFKAEIGTMLLSSALFRIDQPYALCVDQVTGQAYVDGCLAGNFGLQRHDGAELTLMGRPTRSLRFSGGFQYLDTKIKGADFDGTRPVAVPKWSAKMFMEYSPPMLEGLSVNTTMAYTGKSAYNPQNTQQFSSYFTVDLGARYQMAYADDKALTFRIGVENLFDKDYWLPRTSLQFGSARTLKASISADF